MSAIVDANVDEAKLYAHETIIIALGIAVGIVIVSLAFYHVSHKTSSLKCGLTEACVSWTVCRGRDTKRNEMFERV